MTTEPRPQHLPPKAPGGANTAVEADIRQLALADHRLQALHQLAEATLVELSVHKALLDQHSLFTIADAQGRIVHANDRYCQILGRSRAELLGQEPWAIDSCAAASKVLEELWRTIRAGQPWIGELQHPSQDGTLVWFESTIVPGKNVAGEITQLLALHGDITARKKAELELWRSAELLERTGRIAQVGGWELDLPTGTPRWSEQVYRIHEVPLGREISFAEAINFYEPEARPIIQQAVERATREGAPFDLELPFTTARGRRLWVRAQGEPEMHGAECVRLSGTFKDITELKTAQLKLNFELRVQDAVRRMQALYISELDSSKLFRQLLDTLLELGESECGFFGEVLHDADGTPYMKAHAIADAAWNAKHTAFLQACAPLNMEFRGLENLFGRVITSGRQVISNDVDRDGSRTRPPGHPHLQTFLGLPLRRGEELVGMIGIANRHGGYDDGFAASLEPIQEACAAILDSMRKDRQRGQVTEALRRSEERFDLAVRGSRDGIWDWNIAAGEIVYSARLRELLRFSADRPARVGELFDSLVHPADRANCTSLLAKHLERGAPYDMECRLVTGTGEDAWFRVRGQAIWDDRGQPVRMAGSLTDIGDQKRAAQQLQQTLYDMEQARGQLQAQTKLLEVRNAELAESRARSEAATRAKSEFLANMSHEIRTPMTAILGFADLLLNEDGLDRAPPARIAAINTIKRNADILLELLNDILDLSKVEAGRLAVERLPISPARIVTEVRDLMRVRAEAKGLQLFVEFQGELPEVIETDPTRLRQILMNLVGNAIKFTDSGEVRLLAVFRPDSAAGSRIEFVVRDTGMGMTHEQVSRLFQPFMQADASTTRRFGGTGLGLTISQRFAEMLGGNISVTSRLGEGSEFRVSIATGALHNVRLVDGRSAAEPASKPDPAASNAPLQCRILLAEDGPDNQRLISVLLQRAGARVTIVENGALAVEAVCSASDEPFDLVLMDMQMPIMDGYTATRRLRELGHELPIIALTAHAMKGDREKCIEAGCSDYTTKPIDRTTLLATIRSRLQPVASVPR